MTLLLQRCSGLWLLHYNYLIIVYIYETKRTYWGRYENNKKHYWVCVMLYNTMIILSWILWLPNIQHKQFMGIKISILWQMLHQEKINHTMLPIGWHQTRDGGSVALQPWLCQENVVQLTLFMVTLGHPWIVDLKLIQHIPMDSKVWSCSRALAEVMKLFGSVGLSIIVESTAFAFGIGGSNGLLILLRN